jgi:transposase-like protein
MVRKRVKRFTAELKLKVVKEGLLSNVRVAELCVITIRAQKMRYIL